MTATELAKLIADKMGRTDRPRRPREHLLFSEAGDEIDVALHVQEGKRVKWLGEPVQFFRVTVEEVDSPLRAMTKQGGT